LSTSSSNLATAGIQYVKGDATRPQGEGAKILPHIVNDLGLWGAGFVLALSRRWALPEQAYLAWAETRCLNSLPFVLGQVQMVKVGENLWVANMLAQHGVRGRGNPAPIRYDALRECLRSVGVFAEGVKASIHAPRFGCGLAGGSWSEVSKIIEEELCRLSLDVTVYDL